jgi:hypothetical protein
MAEPQPDWTRLEGADRQRVAGDLWQAWRSRRRRVGVVVGFPGVGKSEHLAAASSKPPVASEPRQFTSKSCPARWPIRRASCTMR